MVVLALVTVAPAFWPEFNDGLAIFGALPVVLAA